MKHEDWKKYEEERKKKKKVSEDKKYVQEAVKRFEAFLDEKKDGK